MGGLPLIFILVASTLPIARFASGSKLLEGCVNLFLPLAFYMLLAAYALARAYLVVECFINLSHLSAGVYDVPNWAAYFPHMS